MANKILEIKAPEDLIRNVLLAYAADNPEIDMAAATADEIEAAAIDMILDVFGDKVVENNANQETAAFRKQRREKSKTDRDAIKARRKDVTVKIKPTS
jgi:hypothetical protein